MHPFLGHQKKRRGKDSVNMGEKELNQKVRRLNRALLQTLSYFLSLRRSCIYYSFRKY
jgi:hypothetical protein